MPEPLGRLKRGDILTAERLNAIEERLAAIEDVSGSGGVTVRRTRGGLQIAGIRPNDRFVAVATSNFPIRSGTTVSSGSIAIYWLKTISGATGTIEATGVEIDEAWCISSTVATGSNSILSGQYGYAFLDPYETWWFTPDECPA